MRDSHGARPEALAEWFGAAAKALGQKVLCNRHEGDLVFWPGKSVPFVSKKKIGNGSATRSQRLDNLVGLRLFHLRVVGPLCNQERAADRICSRNRGPFSKESAAGLRRRVAHAAVIFRTTRLVSRGVAFDLSHKI